MVLQLLVYVTMKSDTHSLHNVIMWLPQCTMVSKTNGNSLCGVHSSNMITINKMLAVTQQFSMSLPTERFNLSFASKTSPLKF